MLNQVSTVVCLNGLISEVEVDMAFINDPVYEVIRLVDGTPLFLNEHIQRLNKSLKLLGMPKNYSSEELLITINKMVQLSGILNNNMRIEIGLNAFGIQEYCLFFVKSFYPEGTVYTKGVKTVSADLVRTNPHAKIFRSLISSEINAIKEQKDAFEIIMHNKDGIVSEGSRSNLFFIKENRLYSAKSEDILLGITRDKIIEIAKHNEIECVEQDIKINSIRHFEACFLSGTSIHILPISCIDEITFDSSGNQTILLLKQLFEEMVNHDLKITRRLLEND